MLKRENFHLTAHVVVCSERFQEEDYDKQSRQSFRDSLAMPGVEVPKVRLNQFKISLTFTQL